MEKCSLSNRVVGPIELFYAVVAIDYFSLSQLKIGMNNINTLSKTPDTDNRVDILSRHFINKSIPPQDIW